MILRQMNRKYTKEEYLESVRLLQRLYDRPAITTDVIVGFPGETEELFAETEEFLKQVGFADVHIFPYSRRKGTRAAAMENQVSESVKHERCQRLISLGRELTCAYRESFLQEKQSVLLEEELCWEGEVYFTGHNERYIKLMVPARAGMKSGQLIACRAERFFELRDEKVLLAI